jgi:hypothetical protein
MCSYLFCYSYLHLNASYLYAVHLFKYWLVTYIASTSGFHSDGETFISADDLRINLWNLEISNQSFNIVDVKPTNMEDLTGITSEHTNFVLSCADYIESCLRVT